MNLQFIYLVLGAIYVFFMLLFIVVNIPHNMWGDVEFESKEEFHAFLFCSILWPITLLVRLVRAYTSLK